MGKEFKQFDEEFFRKPSEVRKSGVVEKQTLGRSVDQSGDATTDYGTVRLPGSHRWNKILKANCTSTGGGSSYLFDSEFMCGTVCGRVGVEFFVASVVGTRGFTGIRKLMFYARISQTDDG